MYQMWRLVLLLGNVNGSQKNQVMDFLIECIAQAEAGGYAGFEDESIEMPDEWTSWAEPPLVKLWFGGEEFSVRVTRTRKT